MNPETTHLIIAMLDTALACGSNLQARRRTLSWLARHGGSKHYQKEDVHHHLHDERTGQFTSKDLESSSRQERESDTPLDRARAFVGAQVDASSLPPEQATMHRTALMGVLDTLGPRGLAMFNAHVRKIHLHHDQASLKQVYERLTGETVPEGTTFGGLWDHAEGDTQGELHLAGPLPEDARWQGATPQETLLHLWAHEVGHALDLGHKLSDSKVWRQACQELKPAPNIARPVYSDFPLSRHAASSPAEGWAEYLRLCVVNPERAKRFGKCHDIFKRAGFIK